MKPTQTYEVETQYNADGSVFAASSTAWSYDALDRLTGETYTSSVSGQSYADTFSYDLVGNRLTKTDVSGSNSESIAYTYNNDDQLQTETGTLNGSPEYATTFVDDANGSLISKTRTGADPETDTYTYDLQNQLASATVNGTTTTYATDAAGDQVSQTTSGTTTSSLVDDNNLTGYSQILEQSTGGTITTSCILGDRVLGQGSSGTPSYFVFDGQGSTRLVTDSTGAVSARYSYDAFGNLLGTSPSGLVTSILYTGQQFDAGLGEYDLRARYYDPSTGTFTSFDSANNGNADPTDLHKYLYTGANPINRSDPNFAFTPSVANELFWNNFATFSEGAAYNIGFDSPEKAALATAATKALVDAPALLESVVSNLYDALTGQPSNWPETGHDALNLAVDATIAYLKTYVNNGLPDIKDLPEPFASLAKQIIWGGWSALLTQLKK